MAGTAMHSSGIFSPKFIRCVCRRLSTASATTSASLPNIQAKWTKLDTENFSSQNIGQWYKIPTKYLETLMYKKSLPKYYVKQTDTFLGCDIMIRKPFLEVLSHLRNVDSNAPVVRFALYGNFGSGKSMSLWQSVQYAHSNNWVVCYVPFARAWNRRYTELSISTWNPERLDLPLYAVEWLTLFKCMNEALLNANEVQTTKEYTWTVRENTAVNDSVMSVVDLGISRPKLAADCMGVVLRELKIAAKAKKIKLLVAVDSVNSFYVGARYKKPDKSRYHSSEISIIRHMRKLISNDWNNGAVITTVDNREIGYHLRPGYNPFFLLGHEGFEALDPFIPVEVPMYTEHEAQRCLDYYIEKNWLQNPSGRTENGRRELIHLSAFSPYLLERLVAAY